MATKLNPIKYFSGDKLVEEIERRTIEQSRFFCHMCGEWITDWSDFYSMTVVQVERHRDRVHPNVPKTVPRPR